ncbi:MAG: tetratricopeptide repeat protein [Proteobacteria bacterium]|nr:tetratricopeptide repeat protein [Pseudomonadota bacterium]
MAKEARDEHKLRAVEFGDDWRFVYPASERHWETLCELEDQLDARKVKYETVIAHINGALEQTPEWIEGLTLRGEMHEQLGRPAEAEADYRTAYELGTGALPEGFNDKLIWGDLNNRPFLRAASAYAHLLVQQQRYKDAIPLLRRILKWNPNDNQGVRYTLGPALLRAGRAVQAQSVLRRTADENPAMRYELGLVQIEGEAWIEAATTLRRGGIENPYITPMLCGMKVPAPMALRMGCNLNDRSGALYYTRQWAARWRSNQEATDFLWWLYTHPKVMAERAAVLGPVEELLWEHEPARRGAIIEQHNNRVAAIDDSLSEVIVTRRWDGRNTPDYPWRVLRERQEQWDRGPFGDAGQS